MLGNKQVCILHEFQGSHMRRIRMFNSLTRFQWIMAFLTTECICPSMVVCLTSLIEPSDVRMHYMCLCIYIWLYIYIHMFCHALAWSVIMFCGFQVSHIWLSKCCRITQMFNRSDLRRVLDSVFSGTILLWPPFGWHSLKILIHQNLSEAQMPVLQRCQLIRIHGLTQFT